ncbi:cysteine desulfurase family protein [Olivibacter sp. XZL3]|uniref:cysteine desulfurase family protein n=1 Tax=Olivibacter sp. XZL3 TaxID=1735116 RepID=UPI001066CB47|nr:cysteine desulfurase family protein [Olivibacter sp. XZL3]
MKQIYLDNAATTALHPEVIKVMLEAMEENFGNPSSAHAMGRKAKAMIERSRKLVADLLNVSPLEIYFTSGGTEADNMAISRSVADLGIKQVITSRLEHHAVLHSLEALAGQGAIKILYVEVDRKGNVDYAQLEQLLASYPKSLVSLMHANNEIGTLTDINKVSSIINEYGGVFHSDTVQTMGHFLHNFGEGGLHFAAGAAHKFHGPKGAGFLYINKRIRVKPFIYGGAQERDMRGGTENIYGIVGLAKALELSYSQLDEHRMYIQSLKDYMVMQLAANIPGIQFNGEIDAHNSLYTVLNVSLPIAGSSEEVLFHLDMAGVYASGGSACSAGSGKGSHVLQAIGADISRPSIRFSFCNSNTKEEVDFVVAKLRELCVVDSAECVRQTV